MADRLAHYVALSGAEKTLLDSLEQEVRSYRRGAVILAEQQSPREVYIVRKGWLHSAALLGNGSRQIMRFHFPGELVGLSCLAFDRAVESVTAVTDVELHPVERDRIAALFSDQPRLAALLFTLAVSERVELADRLASIGRTPARARVASLLCEIFTRLRIADGERLDQYAIPLTQEEIGDATGLTAVHVNRMMRGLVEDGIIERSGSAVRILDENRLAEEASFTDRSRVDTSWMPGAR